MNVQNTPPGQTGDPEMAAPIHPRLARIMDAARNSQGGAFAIDPDLSTPLIEPGAATFIWIGEADRVDLLRWIHGGVDRVPFVRVPGTQLWTLRLAVADGGRFEYKICALGGNGETWQNDPLNASRAGDPFGENSVCLTWGYVRPDWSLPGDAPAGSVIDLPVRSAVFDQTRHEKLYLPAGYDPNRPLPLVVFHDGADFMSYADLTVSLDNLIAAKDIPPILGALVQTRDRMGEYPRSRRHARYLAEELLPAIEAGYLVSQDYRDRVLLGASLGAVASLATAFRYPGTFGGLILKSGSFILDSSKLKNREHPVFHRVEKLVRALRRAPKLPETRAFVSTGELEGLADENRALAEVLRADGVDVLFQSSWDGHHWHNWRDQLRDGLMWVLRRHEL